MSLAGSVVAVVVPARNEMHWIGEVIHTMPDWVDHIIVVDDASTDKTASIASATGDPRVHITRHPVRRGVGGAIITGYRRAAALDAAVVAVMAGDAQMDPTDLLNVVRPVVGGDADYVKGNRFHHASAGAMPPMRALGTALFGALTSLATGVAMGDSQCGYTAISQRALSLLRLDRVWNGYGYPNDLLGALALAGLRIVEVPVRAVYRGAPSGLRPYHAAVIMFLLGRVAWRRQAAWRRVNV